MADGDLADDHRRLVHVTAGLRVAAACAALVLLAGSGCGPSQDASRSAATASGTVSAQRVISLAPNLTELVFAAGGAERLVGVVEYSNYPPAALGIERVGDAFRIDYERVARLAPDLLMAWRGGTPGEVIEQLQRLGYHVESFDPSHMAQIPDHLERIGKLLGTQDTANVAAAQFRARHRALADRYQGRRRLGVFFQISARPLFTVGGPHTITEMIRLCGGRNIFADLEQLAPVVEVEAVIARNPDVIVATAGAQALSTWRQWPGLSATVTDSLFIIDPDITTRPGPRLVDGAEALCELLDAARSQTRPRFQSTS